MCMDDSQIVDLYWSRNEQAIRETSNKYGRYCYMIANNILNNQYDAEESVNDTLMVAWEKIPPHRPKLLSTFLGKITRRISLNKLRDLTALKRGGGVVPLVLDELSECIPSSYSLEKEVEMKEITLAINSFLSLLNKTERDLFVCRYWFLVDVKLIAKRFAISESHAKSTLFRMRQRLKKYLQEEGLL